MPINSPFDQTETLDEVLLDVATLIELSARDRRIAENRYHRLKEQLERRTSPLAPYLIDGESLIYAQGSIATSTTIVTGTDDERFDVDAVVELDVPFEWDNNRALDELEIALQSFPNVQNVVRCTRCIQLHFPFMHMDVTPIDRRARNLTPRAGSIFHSPDTGGAYRVPSNPWGFTDWFRSIVGHGQENFLAALASRREATTRDRLRALDIEERRALARADQVELPPMIPNAIDAQEAVALKLLKRFLNLRYDKTNLKRPPSIYLTKLAGDLGLVQNGLAIQLYALADTACEFMRAHLTNGTRPDEANPSYPEDRINDRWPRPGTDGVTDMKHFLNELTYLTARLENVAAAQLTDISRMVEELFGERVGQEQSAVMAKRYDRRGGAATIFATPRTGAMSPVRDATSQRRREVPRHHFHAGPLSFDADVDKRNPRSPKAQLAGMAHQWPDFQAERLPDGTLCWIGPLKPKAQLYCVSVVWNPRLMRLPYVVVSDPHLRPRPSGTFEEIPHLLYNADDPARSGLCLFDPCGKEWCASDLIADTTIFWASEWLVYYELWHLTGNWLAPAVGVESVAQMRALQAETDAR